MHLTFTDFETWNGRAVRHVSTGIKPHTFRLPHDQHLTLTPSLAEHDALFILGHDWIPVHADGLATVDRMVHSPHLYSSRTKAFQHDGDGQKRKAVAQNLLTCAEPLILLGGGPNYYHWLIDYIPRLLITEQFPDYDDCRVLVNTELTRFQAESLELLGIASERLVCAGLGEMVAARTTVVSPLLASVTLCHPAVPRLLRQAFPPSETGSPRRRIYLSRQDAATRRIVNEEDLIQLLERYDFERHVPGLLSFQQQVDLVSEADAVVAVHGAGMANLVFAPKGAVVLEISSPARRVTSMRMLAMLQGLRHEFIDARIPFPTDPNPLLNDWEVDLDAMSAALARAFPASRTSGHRSKS